MERSDRNRRLAAPSCCKAGVPRPTQGSPTLTGRDGERRGVWEAQNTHKHREQHVYNGSTTVQSSKSGLNLLKWSGCHTLLCQRRQQATTSCDHERYFAFGGWGKAQRSRQWLRTVVWVPHRVFKKKKKSRKMAEQRTHMPLLHQQRDQTENTLHSHWIHPGREFRELYNKGFAGHGPPQVPPTAA